MRGVGTGATFTVDIYIDGYTSDDEARRLAGVLHNGGGDALFNAIEKMDRIGKIQLTGRVGFYDLKLIRSHKTKNGRRIIAVTDRPIEIGEFRSGSRSQDYKFGVMQIELKLDKKGKETGEGSLIYAARVKVTKEKSAEIESYAGESVHLRNVRKF